MKIKELVAFVLAVCMIFCFAACGGGDESTSAEQEATGGPEIIDSGYDVQASDGDVYIYWGAKVKNTNENNAYEFYTITITAKDSDGNVVATEDQTMNVIQPGEEQAAGFVFDCNGEEPDQVEFTIDEGDEISPDDSAIKSSDIEITGTNERTDEWGETAFTGTIKNNSEKDTDTIGVVLLLYKDGKIVYGDTTYVDNVKAGGEKALDMSEYEVPEHDSYELHGIDWGF